MCTGTEIRNISMAKRSTTKSGPAGTYDTPNKNGIIHKTTGMENNPKSARPKTIICVFFK